MGGAFVKVDANGTASLPIPSSLEDAKAFLLQNEAANGVSLYEHLSDVILKILEHKPHQALNFIEDISLEVKGARLQSQQQVPREGQDQAENTLDEKLAELQTNLFKSFELTTGADATLQLLPNEGEISDILDESQYFEWAGIGFGREETFRIMLSMKQLLENNPLKSVRFFGKIYGRNKDYLIVESEYKEGSRPEENEDLSLEEQKPPSDESDSESETEEKAATEKTKPENGPIEIEAEIGTGVNKYTYWVTSAPGEAWVRLPNVTPAQITAARSIKKFFTGDLEATISSYPAFPGNESFYLRAQIARIAAGTLISPKGYYSAEDEEDSGEVPVLQVNQEFEGMDPSDLLQVNNWAHYTPHILNQGRCTFFSTKKEPEDDEEEDLESEEQIEEGPKLLSEISEDKSIGKGEAWTAYLSSQSNNKYAHVIVRSNRWPGAFAYARDDRFANIYVGFGHKYNVEPFSPPLPSAVQKQYVVESKEVDDPSVEEEEEYEKSLVKEEIRDESGSGEDEEDEEEQSEEETEED